MQMKMYVFKYLFIFHIISGLSGKCLCINQLFVDNIRFKILKVCCTYYITRVNPIIKYHKCSREVKIYVIAIYMCKLSKVLCTLK